MVAYALGIPASGVAGRPLVSGLVVPQLGHVPLRVLHGPIRWPEVDDPAGPLMVDRDGRILANHTALQHMLDNATILAVPALQADPVDIAVVLLRRLYCGVPASLLACAHIVDDVLTEIGAEQRRKPLCPGSLLTMVGMQVITGRGSLSDTQVAAVLRLGQAVAARTGSDGTWTLRILSDIHRTLPDEARRVIGHAHPRDMELGLWHLAAVIRAPRDQQADLVASAITGRLTVPQLRAAARAGGAR